MSSAAVGPRPPYFWLYAMAALVARLHSMPGPLDRLPLQVFEEEAVIYGKVLVASKAAGCRGSTGIAY